MKIEELKEIAMQSEELEPLRATMVELTELSGQVYKAVMMAETTVDKTELKGKLTLINTLRDICSQRITELSNMQARLNYNFRMAAKSMLKKETFEAIMDMSQYRRRDVKAINNKLRAIPLE